MILQQNLPFSQSLQNNIGVLDLSLAEDAAGCNPSQAEKAFGAYFSWNNSRCFDLSSFNLYNPLGHNHPLMLKGEFKETQFLDYEIKNIRNESQVGNFIHGKECFFNQILKSHPEVSVENFHGYSFTLVKGSPQSQDHSVLSFLNYYYKIKTFSPEGYYNLLVSEVDQKKPQDSRLEGLTLILSKKIDPALFAAKGIYSGENPTDRLYIPLALLIEDVAVLMTRINEVLCSN